MVCVLQKLGEFLLPVGGGEYVGFPAEFLMAQPGLVQAAGGGACQEPAQQGVGGEHGEGLLSQQDFAPGLLLHLPEDLQVVPEPRLVNEEIRGGEAAPRALLSPH